MSSPFPLGDPAVSPQLNEDDIALFRALGEEHRVRKGEYLYRQGDATYDFYVVVSAEIDMLVDDNGVERLIIRHGPGRFLGELSMLTSLRVFVSARVHTSGEVIRVPREPLRQLMASNGRLGDMILAAFIARRSALLETAAPTIQVIGSRYSPETLQLREFLSRTRIPHEWLDVDTDAHVESVLRQFSVPSTDLPVVIVTGTLLRKPTAGELSDYLGLTVESIPERCFDLVVVGGGPAGLAATVYGASEGLRTLGVEKTAPGGQAGTTSRIENYLGFPMGISGTDLTQAAIIQAQKFGASLTVPCAVVSLSERSGYLVVGLADGTEVAGRAVVAATGASYRRLEADGLEQFEGRGVYYAATDLEARQCSGGPVLVAGGGNSAGQAALFLAQNECAVELVIRGGDLGKSMSRYLVDRVVAHPSITVRTTTTISSLAGDSSLERVHLRAGDGEVVVPAIGLFSFIGADPSSGWLSRCAALDERSFVLTDRALSDEHLGDRWQTLGRSPLPFETSRPGLFAVGDLRSGSIKRVASAVGEGSAAVGAVHQYLAFIS